jgi:hypothetical protein
MPQTHKVLGQVNPAAATLTTLYTVPGATSTICSTLSICNTSSTGTTYRVAVRPAGASIATAQYLIYDGSIAGNDAVFLTLGISLAATDIVSVYGAANTLAFSLFGVELT